MGAEQNMNVCMIAYTRYTTDARVRREAETLARHRHNVRMLSLVEKGEKREYILDGVTVCELPVNKYCGKSFLMYILSYFHFLLIAFLRCSTLSIKGKIDAVHIHNMPDFLIFAAIIPRLAGKLTVLDIHDSMLETYSGKFVKLGWFLTKLLIAEEKICCFLAHKVICVNHVQMEPILERGLHRDKVHVIMNVPDCEIFNLKNVQKPSSIDRSKSFNCVYHGTLDKQLGIDLAITAFSEIHKKTENIHFTIFGAGKDQDEFVGLINTLQVQDNVHLNRKMVQVHEVPSMLSSMHLGIIPNRKTIATRLMLPVKLLEYVSLKIPVVAPRLDAIQYYFTEDMIRFYEPGNLQSLIEAIEDIYNRSDWGESLADQASKMLQKYGWEEHQYDFIKIYGGEIPEELPVPAAV